MLRIGKVLNQFFALIMLSLIVLTPVSAQCLTAESFEGQSIDRAKETLNLDSLSSDQAAQVLQYAYLGAISGLLQDSSLSQDQILGLLDSLEDLDYQTIRDELYYSLMAEDVPENRVQIVQDKISELKGNQKVIVTSSADISDNIQVTKDKTTEEPNIWRRFVNSVKKPVMIGVFAAMVSPMLMPIFGQAINNMNSAFEIFSNGDNIVSVDAQAAQLTNAERDLLNEIAYVDHYGDAGEIIKNYMKSTGNDHKSLFKILGNARFDEISRVAFYFTEGSIDFKGKDSGAVSLILDYLNTNLQNENNFVVTANNFFIQGLIENGANVEVELLKILPKASESNKEKILSNLANSKTVVSSVLQSDLSEEEKVDIFISLYQNKHMTSTMISTLEVDSVFSDYGKMFRLISKHNDNKRMLNKFNDGELLSLDVSQKAFNYAVEKIYFFSKDERDGSYGQIFSNEAQLYLFSVGVPRFINAYFNDLDIGKVEGSSKYEALAYEMMRDRDISQNIHAFKKIYTSSEFIEATKNMGTGERLSFAQTVFRMQKNNPSLNLAEAISIQAEYRSKVSSIELFSKDTSVIIFNFKDVKAIESGKADAFKVSFYTDMYLSAGVDKKNIKSYRGTDNGVKDNLLSSIKSSSGKTTLSFNTHGSPGSLGLLVDPATSQRTPENSISYKEFGDALLERYNNGEELNDVSIVLNSCFSYDFAVNLYNHLIESGADSLPIIVGQSNRDAAGTFYESRDMPNVNLNALYKIKPLDKKRPLVLADYMKVDNYVYAHENSFVFVPNDIGGQSPLHLGSKNTGKKEKVKIENSAEPTWSNSLDVNTQVNNNPVSDDAIFKVKQRIVEVNDYFTAEETAYLKSILAGSEFGKLIENTPLAKVVDGQIVYAEYNGNIFRYTADYNSENLLVKKIDDYLKRKGYEDFRLKDLINPNLNPNVGTISEEELHIELERKPDIRSKVISVFMNHPLFSQDIVDSFLQDYPAYATASEDVIIEEIFVKIATDNYYGSLEYVNLGDIQDIVKDVFKEITKKDVAKIEENMVAEYHINLDEKIGVIQLDRSSRDTRLSNFLRKVKSHDISGYGASNLPDEVLALIGVYPENENIDEFSKVLENVANLDLGGMSDRHKEFVILASMLGDIGKLNHDVSEFQKQRYSLISVEAAIPILEKFGYTDTEIQTITQLVFYKGKMANALLSGRGDSQILQAYSPPFASGVSYAEMASMAIRIGLADVERNAESIIESGLMEVNLNMLMHDARSYDRSIIGGHQQGVLESLKETAVFEDVVIRGVSRDHFLYDFTNGKISGQDGVYVREGEGKDDLQRHIEYQQKKSVDFNPLTRNAINERSITYLNGVKGDQKSGAFYVIDYEAIKDMPYKINTKGERVIEGEIPFSKVKTISTTRENYVWMKREILRLQTEKGETFVDQMFGGRVIEEIVDFKDKRDVLADTVYKRSEEDGLGLTQTEAFGVYDYAVQNSRMVELSGYLKAGERKSISNLISDYREYMASDLSDTDRIELLDVLNGLKDSDNENDIVDAARHVEGLGYGAVDIVIQLYGYERNHELGDKLFKVMAGLDKQFLAKSLKHIIDTKSDTWLAHEFATELKVEGLTDFFMSKIDSSNQNSLMALSYFLEFSHELTSKQLVKLYEIGKHVSVANNRAIIGLLERTGKEEVYDYIVEDYYDSITSMRDKELEYFRSIMANSPFLTSYKYLFADLNNRQLSLNHKSEIHMSSFLESLTERIKEAISGEKEFDYTTEDIDALQKILVLRVEKIDRAMDGVSLEGMLGFGRHDMYIERNRIQDLVMVLDALKTGSEYSDSYTIMDIYQREKLIGMFQDWNNALRLSQPVNYYSFAERLFNLGNEMKDSTLRESGFLVAEGRKGLSSLEDVLNPFLIENSLILDVDRSINNPHGNPITIAELSRDKFSDLLDQEAERLGIDSPKSSYYTMSYKGVKFPVIFTDRIIVGDNMVGGHATSEVRVKSDILTDYEPGEEITGEILSYSTDSYDNVNTLTHEFKHKMDQIDDIGYDEVSRGDWEARSMMWEYMFGLNQRERVNRMIDNFKTDSSSIYEEHRVGYNQMFLGFYRKLVLKANPKSGFVEMSVDLDVNKMKQELRKKVSKMSNDQIRKVAFDVYNNYIFAYDPAADIPGGEMHSASKMHKKYSEIDSQAGQIDPKLLVSGLDSHEAGKLENPFFAMQALADSVPDSNQITLPNPVYWFNRMVDKVQSWFDQEPLPSFAEVPASPKNSISVDQSAEVNNLIQEVTRKAPPTKLSTKVASYTTAAAIATVTFGLGIMTVPATAAVDLMSNAMDAWGYFEVVGQTIPVSLGLSGVQLMSNYGKYGTGQPILAYREMNGVKLTITRKSEFHPFGNPELHLDIPKGMNKEEVSTALEFLRENELPGMMAEVNAKGYDAISLITPTKKLSAAFKRLINSDYLPGSVEVENGDSSLRGYSLYDTEGSIVDSGVMDIEYSEKREGVVRAFLTKQGVKRTYGLSDDQVFRARDMKVQTINIRSMKSDIELIGIPGLDLNKLSTKDRIRIVGELSKLSADEKQTISQSDVSRLLSEELGVQQNEFSAEQSKQVVDSMINYLKKDFLNTPKACS